ncbi:MAG: sulfatase [Acidobacteria bacterium]|jgi:arylsulfatase A-like enzyme|nr:sulfatase [Acidobacteriota bacterium]
MIRKAVFTLCLLGLGAAAVLWLRPRPQPPCVILMSIDTLRADHLGCYGYARATSPHIDAFAGEAVQFMQACSQAPSTAASHMSLFTGLLPPVHRVTNTHARDHTTDLRPLSPSIPTLAETLKARGFLTAGFHGGGYVSPEFGFGRGFDLFDHRQVRWDRLWHDHRQLEPIRAWLARSRREKKPLFLFLHHYLCHDPYVKAPRPLVERFLPGPSPLPRWRRDLPPRLRVDETTHERFWRSFDGNDESHRRHVISLYDAGVAHADFVFQRVRLLLEEEKAYDRALVILLADHGEEFWEHGDILHWRLFRESLHVPLLVRFPDAAMAGRKIAAPVRMFDIMPTLLEHLGVPRPAGLQAASLMPLLRGDAPAPAPLASFSNGFAFARILDRGFVYSNQPSGGTEEWLFAAAADPLETRNLAGSAHPQLGRLRQAAAALLKQQEKLGAAYRGGSAVAGMDRELRRQLEALGYL